MNKNRLSVSFLVAASLAISAASPALADSPAPLLGGHPRSLEEFPGSASPAAAETTPAAIAAPVRSAPTKPAKATGKLIDKTMSSPEGKPGECYARVLVAPEMQTVTERVLSREESFELVEIPAVIETVDERTLVRPASERQEIITATTKEVQERILKSPAYTRQAPSMAFTANPPPRRSTTSRAPTSCPRAA